MWIWKRKYEFWVTEEPTIISAAVEIMKSYLVRQNDEALLGKNTSCLTGKP